MYNHAPALQSFVSVSGLSFLWRIRPKIAHGLRQRGKYVGDFACGNFLVEQTEDRPGDVDRIHVRIVCFRECRLDLAEKAILRRIAYGIFLRSQYIVVTASY